MAKNKTTNRDELEGMTKEELVDHATDRGVTVTRGDGTDGEPLKADYVAALASSSSESPGQSKEQTRAAERRLDETIPGGRYLNEAGEMVNADGKRIDEKGKLLDVEE